MKRRTTEAEAGTTTIRRKSHNQVPQAMLLLAFLVLFYFVATPTSTSSSNGKSSSTIGLLPSASVLDKTGDNNLDDAQQQQQQHESLELSGPRLLLIRSINNVPYLRLSDMTAALNAVLEQEPDYLNVQRHWILNRIQPTLRVLTLTKLLDSYGESYTIWDFDEEWYAHVPLQFMYGNNDSNNTLNSSKDNYAALYHDRLLYSINWNGVLNGQLDHGTAQTSAKWILPWTYDMILTPAVHQALSQTLSSRRTTSWGKPSRDQYLVVPIIPQQATMTAAHDNHTSSDVDDYALVARQDATFRFDATLRYGQHSLTWLEPLGLSHLIHNAAEWQPWERQLQQQQLQQATSAPFVSLENAVQVLPIAVPRWTPPFNETQQQLQQDLIKEYLAVLDIQTARDTVGYYPKEQWNLHTDRHALSYERRLARAARRGQPKYWRDAPRQALVDVVHHLHVRADAIFKERFGKWHVAAAKQSKQGKNKMDERLYQSALDAEAWHAMTRNITIWALASYTKGEGTYAKYAVKQLKEWFWNDDTSMTPRLPDIDNNPQLWWEFLDLTFLLDAAKIISKGGFFTERQEMLFVQWCTDFREWMISIHPPLNPTTAAAYNAILVAVSYFTKNDALAYRTLATAPRLLPGLRDLIAEKSPQHVCTRDVHRALYAWHVLARQSHIMGIHLWKVKPWWDTTTTNGTATTTTNTALTTWRIPDDPLYGTEWPKTSALCDLTGQIARKCARAKALQRHWNPLWEGYRRFCPGGADVVRKVLPATRYDMHALFDAEHLVAPFWNLGYRLHTGM